MAQRYGHLPSEILDLTIEEYGINEVIMRMGMVYEASVHKGKTMVLTTGHGRREEVARKLGEFFDARKDSKVKGRTSKSLSRRK